MEDDFRTPAPGTRRNEPGLYVLAAVMLVVVLWQVVKYLVGDAHLNAMDKLTATGVWLQAIILLVAAIVATVQLWSLNRNEKVRNTLSFIERYYREDIHSSAALVTASWPAAEIQDARLHEYRTLKDAACRGGVLVDPDMVLRFQSLHGHYLKTYNYFDAAEMLLQRHVLDSQLFLRLFGPTITAIVYASGGVLGEIGSEQKTDVSSIERLRRVARKVDPGLAQFDSLFERLSGTRASSSLHG
jgi:hypothetical protein